MKDEREYLAHILRCIERIERYTAGGREEFLQTDYWQDVVIRNLQILAESTQRLAPETKATQPAIPWGRIARFRNVATHDYLDLDWEVIWEITRTELVPLRTAVAAILRERDAADTAQ